MAERLRALLVEDEFMIAMLLESHFTAMGVQEVVLAMTLEEGVAAAGSEDLDFAVLDVNLDGEQSFAIAEELERRGIPFTFSTGYAREEMADRFAGRPMLPKPCCDQALRRAVGQMVRLPG